MNPSRPPAAAAAVVVALVLALAGAGCGATPPQAPLAQAKHLDSSLSAISTACGLADQAHAFARQGGAASAGVQHLATVAVGKLARVDERDPAWIYQGQSVRRIVIDAVKSLRGCGLARSAAVLATRAKR